jgi:hypothetical protein
MSLFAPPRARAGITSQRVRRWEAEILRHNTACQQDEVRQATLMGPQIDEARMAGRVVRANVLRVSLGLRALPVCWGAAAEAGRTLGAEGGTADAV